MKKLMNSPDAFVDEMLAGLVAAHPSLVQEGRIIRHASGARKGKVGIVSGGGSGHLPLFTGYVGDGLLDACAIGDVFASPSVDPCIQAIRAADGGSGVLRLYGNYGGDCMNFDLAGEMVEIDGIETTTVLGTDDIASAAPEDSAKRRGVAGIIFAYKIAGAKAEKATKGRSEIGWDELGGLLAPVRDQMMARGGAKLGDKTVVDMIDAVTIALDACKTRDEASEAAQKAARETLAAFRDRPNKLGRARMFGERTVGLDDPGMLALSRLLTAVAA
jgi:dihydroxyacetone kinase